MMELVKKTPLNQVHRNLKARMIDFAGWELPVWYTSALEEHQAVRSSAGMFDVSYMGRVWVAGTKAGDLLDRLLTKPAQPLAVGSAQLCLLCLENGGILDDLWDYCTGTGQYLLIANANNIEWKLDWLHHWRNSSADITIDYSPTSTAMIAVQGPSVSHLESLKPVSGVGRFKHQQTVIGGIKVLAARTGYTGEDGFELICNAEDALSLWNLFMEQGVKPCGLGARDSLRLEAGMLLYGQDINTDTNPFEAGLGWLLDLNRGNFVGKDALLKIKQSGIRRKLIGFQVQGRGVARTGYKIFNSGKEVGEVTSGGYSPTLGTSIGLGYVPIELANIGTDIEILVRNKSIAARITDRRFYRRGV